LSASDSKEYDGTALENKLYDLDSIQENKDRSGTTGLSVQVEGELKTLLDKMYMEISVLASSRALYKINLIVNQEKNFPKVQTLAYVKCLNLLISRYLGQYYQDAFNLLVEELVSDTDKDGMLMYLKERGFYMTVNDFQKYLFEKDA
jgi:hypothetical protein